MTWIARIRARAGHCRLAPPATVDRIEAVELALGVELPGELRTLLREADGIVGRYGEEVVWPTGKILEENLACRGNSDFRGLYMPFDHLLFFARAINGDLFAFCIQADGSIHRTDIFIWDHEVDSRSWVDSSLESYLERSLAEGP